MKKKKKQQTMKPRYNVGTSVEVSLPDKEWHGVWFPATILKEIDHDFFLIGYKSLGLDDKEGCLKEVTDAVHIRPSPPETSDNKVFAASEEVDVYYDCGWWSGQVKDILPGNRYIVWFNCQKERREFNHVELRCHMEWMNGTWVQDSQQTKGLRFNRRTPVEVCLPDKLCRGAWFPATVLEEVEDGFFWVQYNFLRLGDNGECLKDIVNAQQIRPSPPEDGNGRNFVVLEEVDVFYDFVWWEGNVTEVLAGNQYNVSFKHEKKRREFNQSELRSHMSMVWINGKWVQNLQDKNAECHQGNFRNTDQQQLQVGIVANKSNTRKRKIEHWPHELGKNLKKGGVSEGTMPDRTMIESGTYIDLVTPSPKAEEALIQKKKDISQNMIEVFVSQSEGIRFNLRKEFGKEKFSNVLDVDLSGIDSSLPSPSIMYEAPVQFLQKSHLVQSPPHTPKGFAGDEIQQQRGEKEKETTTTLETRGQSKEIVAEASDKEPMYTTPSTEMTKVVQTECTSEKTEMIAAKALSNIEDLQSLSMCSEELYGTKDKQDIKQQRGEVEKETTTILERREQSKEMVTKASAEDPMNKNPSIEITEVVQTECTSGRTGMIVTETLSSIEDMHPLSICSEDRLEQKSCNKKRRKGPRKQSQFLLDPLLPSGDQQCRRTGKLWRCHEMSLPEKIYCEKHQLEQVIHNKKRRKGPKRESSFALDPVLPSGHSQCRRTGKGWRCSEMASFQKLYCEKHQLEQDTHNAEKRRKRQREHISLVASDSDKSRQNNSSCPLPSDYQQCSGVVVRDDTNQHEGEIGGHETANLKTRENSEEMFSETSGKGEQATANMETRGQSEEILSEAPAKGEQPTANLETRIQQEEMISEDSAQDSVNTNPSVEITEVVQTECTSGRAGMIVTETLSSIEDVHPLSMCSEGVLPDNRLASHSSMPITSREVSMGGRKVQNSSSISKCSTSREHCNKAVEDVPSKTDMHENRDPMNKPSSIEIAEVVQTECTSGRTEINVTETLSSIEDLQPQSMCSEDFYRPAKKDNSVAPDNELASHPTMPNTSRELSMGGQEVQNSSYVSKCYMRRKHCNKAVEEVPCTTGMHENRGEITFENGNLPFVKNHPLWENLESRDIFHLTLQRPHFRTLLESNELLREGQALGYMVSFVDIVEKISKAQVNVPKSDLEKILKGLDDLKPFGFNVHPVCARVEELLGVQDTLVQLDEKLKEIVGKLMKETYVKESLNSEVNEINDELWKLQESINEINKEREKAIMEMQTIGSSIIELLERFHETKNDIYAINLEFDRVAATPW